MNEAQLQVFEPRIINAGPITLEADHNAKPVIYAQSIWDSSQEVLEEFNHAFASSRGLSPNPDQVRTMRAPKGYQHKIRKDDLCLVLRMVDEFDQFTGVQLINEKGARVLLGSPGVMVLQSEPWTRHTTFHFVIEYETGAAVEPLYGAYDVAIVVFDKARLERVSDFYRARIIDLQGFTPQMRVHWESNNVALWEILQLSRAKANG